MQILVQRGSEVTSAKWNHDAKQWTVQVTSTKDGSTMVYKPNHIVFAAGFYSDVPHITEFKGARDFQGPIIPSAKFTTVSHISDYRNKMYIVVGSSASAHDVAQDIAEAGCKATMIQRDSNMVYSLNSKVLVVGAPYSKHGITTPESDNLANSMPFPVAITMMVGGTQMIYQMDKELLDRVGKTEFKFLKGDDGRGMLHLVLKKGGGHYPDQGSLELIANGAIQVRQCDEGIERITPKGVLLADRRDVEGDAIVMATGYKHADHTVCKIFGDDVASKCDVAIGFNDYGELRGVRFFTNICVLNELTIG
jgi:cation diffusion facilitator CzcD-associated flavoprotein CzcO